MATPTVEKQNGPKGEGLTLEQAKQLFSANTFDTSGNQSLIQAYYHPDVRFRDAIQELHGRDAFIEMTRRFVERAKELKVEVHDAAQNGDVIFLDWTMKLKFGPAPLTEYHGTTKLTLDAQGKVVEHRDFFDLWGDALSGIPGVGKAYRMLVKHLG
jgi:limonene-1,2-epoxide hydrolase